MQVLDLDLPDVKLITPQVFEDERGFFTEVYNRRALQALGIDLEFVQENHSLSVEPGTIRGLHFQTPPHAIHKLVRVVRGSIFDVAVDVRRASPTYGRHVALTLTASGCRQILVPAGFAHGFCTLEPDTEVVYKVTDHWDPEWDAGLLWNDPALGIEWPVAEEQAVLSDKDRQHPKLAELPRYFE